MIGRLTGARPGYMKHRLSGANIQRLKLTTKKKTLNNVKTNIFIMKTFIRGNLRRALIKKHLLSITDGRGAK